LFKTLESFGMLMNGTDRFWKDDVLSRCGAHHHGEPPAVGRVPIGPAHIADILPEEAGCETECGILEIAAGLCTRPAEIPNGFLFAPGDLHHGESTRARQASQWPGVPAVRFDPILRLLGNQRRRYHPAIVAGLGQIVGEPVAAGSSFRDKEKMWGFCLPLSDHLIDVTLAGADGPKVRDLGAVLLRDVSHGNRVFVNVHCDEEWARLGHS
jgi:hypothetical protein